MDLRRVVARVRPDRLLLLGHPVAQSLSPVFQNAALRAGGFAQQYAVRDVAPDALAAALDAFAHESRAGYHTGGNVTIPHKERMWAATTVRSALADQVGAVNTFWYDDGVLHGHNTDVAGAAATLRALCPDGLAGRPCALLGAGGSAAAVLVALQQAQCTDIRMWSRTMARVDNVAVRTGVAVTACPNIVDAVQHCALVINATPVGLRDDAMVVEPSRLSEHAVVFDLVYRIGETAWVRACRQRGLLAEDGRRMLIEQGAAAFECWFDAPAPRTTMWRALEPTAA